MTAHPSWLTGILAKRTPDALRVLADLCEAGLRTGRCSANDVRGAGFAEPNIVGATFKCLPSLGFVCTGDLAKTEAGHKHGRRVYVYALVDPARARAFLDACRRQLLAQAQAAAQPCLPGM